MILEYGYNGRVYDDNNKIIKKYNGLIKKSKKKLNLGDLQKNINYRIQFI